MWSSQKCNQEWSSRNHYIDWRSSWLYFNHNKKPTYNITNFKLNQSKSFKIKFLLNELPTYSHYHYLFPELFPNNTCFHCMAPDSHSHWLSCNNPLLP